MADWFIKPPTMLGTLNLIYATVILLVVKNRTPLERIFQTVLFLLG